jgi:hypothetical protein
MEYRTATLNTFLVALLFTNDRDQQARSRCPHSQDGCAAVRDTEC